MKPPRVILIVGIAVALFLFILLSRPSSSEVEPSDESDVIQFDGPVGLASRLGAADSDGPAANLVVPTPSFLPASAFIEASPNGKSIFQIVELTDSLRMAYSNMEVQPNCPFNFVRDRNDKSMIYHPAASKVLMATLNSSFHPVALLRADETFLVPQRLRRVIVEVGTNVRGETADTAMRPEFSDALFICFEPQPAVYRTALADFPLKSNLIYIPAAAASGMITSAQFSTAAANKCSSMLPMNEAAEFAACSTSGGKVTVAVMPLWLLFNIFIPNGMPLTFFMIDAQGFDLNVAGSMRTPKGLTGELAKRFPPNAPFITPDNFVFECQDVSDKKRMLVEGGYNCAMFPQCIPQYFGELFNLVGCHMQNPTIRENNCLYVKNGTRMMSPSRLGLGGFFRFKGGRHKEFVAKPSHMVCP